MDFPQEYFRAEVRDGFYVDGMLKRAWAEGIEVLNVIDEICSKHHITWYADNGTLLGAVRHGGYIPWDDDVDICMMRDDFMRFREIVEEELPEGWRFLSWRSRNPEDRIYDSLCKVSNARDVYMDEDYLNQHHQFPYTTTIDIFVLDYLPRDQKTREEWVQMAALARETSLLGKRIEDPKDMEAKKWVDALARVMGYSYNKEETLSYQVDYLVEQVFAGNKPEDCDEIALLPYFLADHSHVYQKSWYEHTIQIQFENVMLPVPLVFDGVLETEYGKNYGIPYRGGWIHEFPYFAKLERLLYPNGKIPFRYQLDEAGMKALLEKRECKAPEREKVVFIISHADRWKYVEAYYLEKRAAGAEVKVVVVPYYYVNFRGLPISQEYEIDRLPADLPIVSCVDIDLEQYRPSEIVTSDPFDRWNCSECIDPGYFTSELRKNTDKLTYISPFTTDEPKERDPNLYIVMEHYVNAPALFYADEIRVQSEEMKQGYIRKLIEVVQRKLDAKEEWAEGFENLLEDDIRAIFENKIHVMPELKEVNYWHYKKENLEMPASWERKLKDENGNWKKAVYYNMNLGVFFRNPEKAIKQLEKVLLKEETDHQVFIYRPEKMMLEYIQLIAPEVEEQYQKFLAIAEKKNNIILDEEEWPDLGYAISDSYYGDGDSTATLFQNVGRQVVLEKLEG